MVGFPFLPVGMSHKSGGEIPAAGRCPGGAVSFSVLVLGDIEKEFKELDPGLTGSDPGHTFFYFSWWSLKKDINLW